MITKDYIEQVQQLVRDQEPRKRKLGKPDFNNNKFWEELKELRNELNHSIDLGVPSSNLMNELGDFLFCVLSRPAQAAQLQRRMEFNLRRIEAYRYRDEMIVHALNQETVDYLNNLKFTPQGWRPK